MRRIRRATLAALLGLALALGGGWALAANGPATVACGLGGCTGGGGG